MYDISNVDWRKRIVRLYLRVKCTQETENSNAHVPGRAKCTKQHNHRWAIKLRCNLDNSPTCPMAMAAIQYIGIQKRSRGYTAHPSRLTIIICFHFVSTLNWSFAKSKEKEDSKLEEIMRVVCVCVWCMCNRSCNEIEKWEAEKCRKSEKKKGRNRSGSFERPQSTQARNDAK